MKTRNFEAIIKKVEEYANNYLRMKGDVHAIMMNIIQAESNCISDERIEEEVELFFNNN